MKRKSKRKIRRNKFHVWKDESGEWRAALVSPNGKSMWVNGEGWKNRAYAVERCEWMWMDAPVVGGCIGDRIVFTKPTPARNRGPRGRKGAK